MSSEVPGSIADGSRSGGGPDEAGSDRRSTEPTDVGHPESPDSPEPPDAPESPDAAGASDDERAQADAAAGSAADVPADPESVPAVPVRSLAEPESVPAMPADPAASGTSDDHGDPAADERSPHAAEHEAAPTDLGDADAALDRQRSDRAAADDDAGDESTVELAALGGEDPEGAPDPSAGDDRPGGEADQTVALMYERDDAAFVLPVADPPRAPMPRREGRHSAQRAQRGPRVTQRLLSVDPWSVFKISFLFYLCVLLVLFVAGLALWSAGRSLGTIDAAEGFVTRLGAYGSCVKLEEVPEGTAFEEHDDCREGEVLVGGFELDGGTLMRAGVLGGGILVLAASIGNVLLAVLLNLLNEVTGGIRHTVVTESPRRADPGSTARRRRR